MTTQANIPAKWYVPFANDDASRVEIPVTTADPTRASQTLGFPPLTMQPPESGGVPPQGEDFNGGMNQIARVAWWVLNGGGWPYDASFAMQANINGYPNGATLQAADLRGDWISLADNNTTNPDTGSGTTWVPGFQYGVTALTGLTGGTVTPTPAQAAKNSITLAGTLGSALTIVLPTWLKNWTITNNTTGAFVTIVKTASGSGVTIPQNGAPTRVSGDGTNIVQSAENIAPATSPTHAVPMSQAAGVVGNVRNLAMSVTAASANATLTADEIIVETALGGVRYCLPSFNKTVNLAATGAGGMDTGSAPTSGYVALYAIYNPTTGASALLAKNATSAVQTEVYSGANMPAGYTASALVSVWPTNGSGQFVVGRQRDRRVSRGSTQVLNTSTQQASYTSLSISGAVPANAVSIKGYMSIAFGSGFGAINMSIASDTSGTGVNVLSMNNAASASVPSLSGPYDLQINTAQTVYWFSNANGGGSYTITVNVVDYYF